MVAVVFTVLARSAHLEVEREIGEDVGGLEETTTVLAVGSGFSKKRRNSLCVAHQTPRILESEVERRVLGQKKIVDLDGLEEKLVSELSFVGEPLHVLHRPVLAPRSDGKRSTDGRSPDNMRHDGKGLIVKVEEGNTVGGVSLGSNVDGDHVEAPLLGNFTHGTSTTEEFQNGTGYLA